MSSTRSLHMLKLTFRHSVAAAFVLGTALSLGHPALATAAPGAAPGTLPPRVMSEAAAQAAAPYRGPRLAPFASPPSRAAGRAAGRAATQRPAREVFGFVNAGNLADPSVGYRSWQLSLLTTVAYFGLHVDAGTGNLVQSDTGWAVWNSSDMSSFISAAHGAGVKVVVSIVLQDFSGTNSSMCAGLQKGGVTIGQVVQQVRSHGVDGVNVDYEGLAAPCAGSTTTSRLTGFVQSLRGALPAGSDLSVDTYGGSAADPSGFFDIPGLAPSVDSFFVMAYDLDQSNWQSSPLNCASYCLSPVAPLTAYRYNDTDIAAQYSAAAGASKVILGVPYYGRTDCAAPLSAGRPGPNATAATPAHGISPTYLDSTSTNGYTGVSNYASARGPIDTAGAELYSTWQSSTYGCWRESYWDDATALAQKYALVDRDGLRGVGVFSLDYGGGSPELWNLLSAYFSCPTAVSAGATQSSTKFTVTASAPGCAATSFDFQQYADSAQGWLDAGSAAAGSGGGSAGSVSANGFAGHTYFFRARAHWYGLASAWSDPITVAVAAGAALAHPFQGLYTLDDQGGLGPLESPPLAVTAWWPGWNIARAASPLPGGAPESGLVLDGWGGLHPYGAGTITTSGGGYWPGWDIARDIAILPDGSGGYTLDGWGGLHPFGINGHAAPPATGGGGYWRGWDIAKKVVVFSDGKGGYTLDGWGGIHPFGIGANPTPSGVQGGGYWPGWDIARDIVLIPGTHSGYLLDGWGGIHPFAPPGETMPKTPSGYGYWNWDIARSIWLAPGSTGANPVGYTLDGWGGVHPFGGAPAVSPVPYWPGRDVARALVGG